MSAVRRQQLFREARAFCDSFAAHASPDEMIAKHFSAKFLPYRNDISVLEHGVPQIAPFVGRKFQGKSGVRKYFETVSQYLTYDNVSFLDSDFMVDPQTYKVAVRGKGRFTWKSTGQSWIESIHYQLSFAELEIGCLMRLVSYEVWADTGAAYLASKGLLDVSEGSDSDRTPEVIT
ncbi:hypothetical protein QBC46DRAFT_167723 [Diplogelasinospora grovesii]|uniref:SnoaL-like domain-containing protein n=1 Tax=Diplogelasinospora grovesii TaxID=303347 RepID=A0AAN6N379_9PEZI|nr:hypothetical protein QBC46DRAFT_167723 [Diplogelasinospora grovesii]